MSQLRAISDRDGGAARDAGFSLMEVLVTLTILTMMMAAFTPLTGRLLHAWSRHSSEADRLSEVTAALDRLRRDAAAAFPYLVTEGARTGVQFTGSSTGFTLVTQDAAGPQTIAVSSIDDGKGEPSLVRDASAAAPTDSSPATRVALLYPPLEARFSYRIRSGETRNSWLPSLQMPTAIEVTFLDKGEVLFGGAIPLPIYSTQSMTCLTSDETPPGLCSIRRPADNGSSPGSASAPRLTIETPTIAP